MYGYFVSILLCYVDLGDVEKFFFLERKKLHPKIKQKNFKKPDMKNYNCEYIMLDEKAIYLCYQKLSHAKVWYNH